MKTVTKLWIGLGVLVMLSPLGLIFPEHFNAGGAWGEWSIEKIQKLVGYIPIGMEKLSKVWNAPIAGYIFNGCEVKGLSRLSFAYMISALIGIAIVIAVVLLVGRIFLKKDCGCQK